VTLVSPVVRYDKLLADQIAETKTSVEAVTAFVIPGKARGHKTAPKNIEK
jgi:hypothetical protein